MNSSRMAVRADFGVRMTVQPDPLGPVNKILTIWAHGQRAGTVLRPVREDAVCRLGYDSGTPRFTVWASDWAKLAETPYRPPCWYIEVDGRRVLEVAESQIKSLAPLRRPIPWRTRAQWRLRKWFYAAVDRVVVPLGYHHEDDCGDYR